MRLLKFTNLALIAFCLFAAACRGFYFCNKGKVSVEEVLKMKSFVATVEAIDVQEVPGFKPLFPPDVTIILLQHGTGDRFLLYVPASNKFGRELADFLHEGESYMFPQVITNLMTVQHANVLK
ncbi:MAG: hypothetical protein WCK57_12285 [Verrucomicrobiae bacterium]